MRAALSVLTRLVAAVLGVALAAAGAVLVVEVVAAALGLDHPVVPDDLTERLGRTGWDDPSVRTTLAVMFLVGVVTLALGLWRRAPGTVPVGAPGDVRVERSALERSLRRRLEALDGASSARVRADGGRLVARVESDRRRPPTDLRERAERVLADEVAALRLPLSPSVSVRYRGGEL